MIELTQLQNADQHNNHFSLLVELETDGGAELLDADWPLAVGVDHGAIQADPEQLGFIHEVYVELLIPLRADLYLPGGLQVHDFDRPLLIRQIDEGYVLVSHIVDGDQFFHTGSFLGEEVPQEESHQNQELHE